MCFLSATDIYDGSGVTLVFNIFKLKCAIHILPFPMVHVSRCVGVLCVYVCVCVCVCITFL